MKIRMHLPEFREAGIDQSKHCCQFRILGLFPGPAYSCLTPTEAKRLIRALQSRIAAFEKKKGGK